MCFELERGISLFFTAAFFKRQMPNDAAIELSKMNTVEIFVGRRCFFSFLLSESRILVNENCSKTVPVPCYSVCLVMLD
jgi:hypothetical protein